MRFKDEVKEEHTIKDMVAWCEKQDALTLTDFLSRVEILKEAKREGQLKSLKERFRTICRDEGVSLNKVYRFGAKRKEKAIIL